MGETKPISEIGRNLGKITLTNRLTLRSIFLKVKLNSNCLLNRRNPMPLFDISLSSSLLSLLGVFKLDNKVLGLEDQQT